MQCVEKVLWLNECVKSHLKFCSGGFLLDNVPRSGRPVELDTDQITTLNENNQCYTTWEMANILKIPKSIKLLVKIKKYVFYFMQKNTWMIFWPNQYTKRHVWFVPVIIYIFSSFSNIPSSFPKGTCRTSSLIILLRV